MYVCCIIVDEFVSFLGGRMDGVSSWMRVFSCFLGDGWIWYPLGCACARKSIAPTL